MKRREFGETIKMYLVEEDRLVKLLELEHRYNCLDKFPKEVDQYFWDIMVESGCDQRMPHEEFIETVKNMTFNKLAEMDLTLYTEYVSSGDLLIKENNNENNT